MPKYTITFRDGHVSTVDAPSGDVAKPQAKHARKLETGAEDPSDARIVVASVAEAPATPATASASTSSPTNGAARPALVTKKDDAPAEDPAAKRARLQAELAALDGGQ